MYMPYRCMCTDIHLLNIDNIISVSLPQLWLLSDQRRGSGRRALSRVCNCCPSHHYWQVLTGTESIVFECANVYYIRVRV